MFGQHEEIEEDESVTESRGGGRSRTVSAKRVRREAVMPSDLMSVPMPSPESGLTFYALTPLGAYRKTIPGKTVDSMLSPANADPARGGMVNSEPVPVERQKLLQWGAADYVRLKLNPPQTDLAMEQPQEEMDEGPEETEGRRKRKKLRLVRAGNECTSSQSRE